MRPSGPLDTCYRATEGTTPDVPRATPTASRSGPHDRLSRVRMNAACDVRQTDAVVQWPRRPRRRGLPRRPDPRVSLPNPVTKPRGRRTCHTRPKPARGQWRATPTYPPPPHDRHAAAAPPAATSYAASPTNHDLGGAGHGYFGVTTRPPVPRLRTSPTAPQTASPSWNVVRRQRHPGHVRSAKQP